MPGSISISELRPPAWRRPFLAASLVILAGILVGATPALAADSGSGPSGGSGSGKSFQPEEDDYSSTPFTEYGEFNEDNDEEADANFFAHGRFFGVSLGMGFEGVTGNRGILYQGGFPMVDFKIHYWFDFNFALDLNLYYASHFYEAGSIQQLGHVDVNIMHAGIDGKYYIDTKNLSAAISFANPYVLVGFGSYSKTENSFALNNNTSDTGIGADFGAGLEFTLSPKKAYLELEGRFILVGFKDTNSTLFSESPVNAPDLTGGFYTLCASILWTW